MPIHIPINEHIILTEVRTTDTASLSKHINDKEIYNNTLLIPHPYTEKDAVDFVNYVHKTEKDQQLQQHWAIRHQGEMIGGIGIHYNFGYDAHKSELGYWLGKSFRRQGIMTQVVEKFTTYCLAETDLIRLQATVFNHNEGSKRILEKLGYEREGLQRKAYVKDGKYFDAVLYAKVK